VNVRRIYYSALIVLLTVLTFKIMLDMRIEDKTPTIYDKHDIEVDYGQN